MWPMQVCLCHAIMYASEPSACMDDTACRALTLDEMHAHHHAWSHSPVQTTTNLQASTVTGEVPQSNTGMQLAGRQLGRLHAISSRPLLWHAACSFGAWHAACWVAQDVVARAAQWASRLKVVLLSYPVKLFPQWKGLPLSSPAAPHERCKQLEPKTVPGAEGLLPKA